MEQTLTTKIKDFNNFTFACNHFGIEINNNQLDLFEEYYRILLEWNKKINLISRSSVNSADDNNNLVLEKHFLDSILFLPEIESLKKDTENISLLDIGSGGGFPGIIFAIMKPHWEVTLCDSIKKKANFLESLVKELKLGNKVKVLNERVENINNKNKFDIITARAITKLNELIIYSIPLLKKDGYLAAYKAENIDEEVNNSRKLIEKSKLSIKIFSKEINSVKRKLVVLSNSGIF